MGVHKLTAGDGYLYLIRQVAAADGTDKGRTSLSSYYSEKGESPGQWIGRGLAALATPVGRDEDPEAAENLWRVAPGSEVTEDQMKAIFGLGMHPNAAAIVKNLIAQGSPQAAALHAAKLGRPFHINDGQSEFQKRLAVAYRDHNLSQGEHWNAPIDEEVRAQMRTTIAKEMFAEQYGRPPSDSRELAGFIARESRELTTSVAGYDFTFTPPKSVSVLWALAPMEIARIIEKCHDRAVADALDFLQEHAAFTRIGSQGVAQINTEGFIAAKFTHRDSRAGDPNLHSHVAVSNKVLAIGPDGVPRWLALDGRPIFKATVSASELYNTNLEGYLTAALPIVCEDRASDVRGKRPVREIVGIPASLNELMSSRRTAIKQRYNDLAKQFQRDHGREPTMPEALMLSQRATLETRQAKHEPRSWAEQRQQWRAQAIEHLGGQNALNSMLSTVLSQRSVTTVQITDEWIEEQAAAVIDIVSESRSTWQRNHVLAEALRVVRHHNLATTDLSVAEAITAVALQPPYSTPHVRDVDADLGEPSALRRRDGASIYSTHGTDLYTSPEIKAAERRILAAAMRLDGRRLDERSVDLALLEQKARGRELNAGQEALVRHMGCSGARLALALAPGGTGKTTAMATLARAWQDEGGNVIGLSPSASAAQILRNDMHDQGVDIPADTVDKLVWLHNNIDRAADDPARKWFDTIGPETLLIIDEAGKAGTRALDTVRAIAEARGASVKLIADDKQLASISAGGVLRDIAATAGSVTLTEVMRFRSRAEAAATLALRDGDPAALAYYADNHRIHVASEQTAADTAFVRWRADIAKGWDSLLLAPTNETVAELNERARRERLDQLDATGDGLSGDPAEAVTLSDGLHASVGDVVATRHNNRRLRLAGGRDFVRNGYRWKVTAIGKRGSLTVSQLHTNQTVTLPGWYVREHVTLGYAATIDTAQGATAGTSTVTGTCHIVASESLTRQKLYVAASRAKDESHIYLSTAEDDPHRVLTTKALHPDTAIDVLTRVLARDGAQRSATTETREALDPFNRLGSAAARYADALGSGAEHLVGTREVLAIEAGAERLLSGLTDQPAWPVLRKHLAVLKLGGDEPIERLADAINEGGLGNVRDTAAVLDWRLDHSGKHSSGVGPLQWLPAVPTQLRTHPEWGEFLTARAELVADLANQIRQAALEWTPATAPKWARPLLAEQPRLVAEIAVFRAATNVDQADTRVTGPQQYPVRARAIQRMLDNAAQVTLGRPGAETERWRSIVNEFDHRITRDPYWPQLAAHMATIARTGVDLRQLLNDAFAHGPLPDEMPGAALWWRLCGTLTPAALEIPNAMLRPEWLSDLHAVFGSALAESIAGDPAFPGLVAAIAAADPARWNARDLLEVAHEHLRDTDHQPPLRADEYARLLTYSIDLFTTANPFDRDIPLPDHPPITPEELEELRHHYPDPANPLDHPDTEHALTDEMLLHHLGFLDVVDPTIDELIPPDPLEQQTAADDLGGLAFEDLPAHKPATRSLRAALADVAELRTAYQQAHQQVEELTEQILAGHGPAIKDAEPTIAQMRRRAVADRPYELALADVVARWSDAEAEYDKAVAYLDAARDHLNHLRATPHTDPADIASAEIDVRVATELVPPVAPAEQFHDELTAARRAREDAAGGADQIISHRDVDRYLDQLRQEDTRTLNTARARRSQLRRELEQAEAAAALAFAEAHSRNADYISDRVNNLRTELAVLTAAGGYDPQRAIKLSQEATHELEPLAARGVTTLASNGFTVTPVHTGDRATALAAMSVLHAAATDADRKVLWCTPTPELDTEARTADVADTYAPMDQTERNLREGTWELPERTILVIDHAADVQPETIAAIAEHASQRNATLLLLDPDTDRWPPRPSSALLKLLHKDLPWSSTLSVAPSSATRRSHQLDLEPLLDQADRYDRAVLPDAITDALEQRQQLREAHLSSHRVHNLIWRAATDRNAAQERDLNL
ncbi:relaxase domain-containing protein [Mycolicibacterium goodii]|nr:relaxase domain-containing protein [Mycolicibacterium goodii]